MRTPAIAAVRPAAFRFIVLFVSLFVVSLPFSYDVLPDIGGCLSPVSEVLVRLTADHVLHVTPPYTVAVLSDSTGMYVHTLNLVVLSALICIAWSVLEKRGRDYSRLRNLFHAAVSYYLALQLFKYGFDKLFKHQFGLPEPNILLTPVGYLTRDILYWSTLGASYFYNVCAGLLEILPAALLLFKRTRVLGGLLAIAAIVHVVIINFGFDISVKLYSCFLLLLCAIVAAPGLRRMYQLFILHVPVDAPRLETLPKSRRNLLLSAVARAIVIVAVLAESLFGYFAAGNFNDDRAPRPFLHGAYDVELFVRNGDTLPPTLAAPNRCRRLFIHSRGYFITQSMNDSMQDYGLAYDIATRRLMLRRERMTAGIFNYALTGNDSVLALAGRLDGDSVTMRARRIDLERLPLVEPSFHWTIDDYH